MTTRVVHQCPSLTKNGTRCKKRTSTSKCWVHIQSIDHLRIKKSGIKDGGLGLYATKDLKKDHRIPYTGRVAKELPEDKHHPYALEIKSTHPKMYIDANKSTDGLGRWSNSCRTINRKKGECTGNNANLKLDTKNRKAMVKLTRNVKKHREILTSYGREYFK